MYVVYVINVYLCSQNVKTILGVAVMSLQDGGQWLLPLSIHTTV